MATAVKEKPILFSGPMVRAILDGRKTQTRRVIKPQPGPTASLHFDGVQWYADGLIADCKGGPWHCPYGDVGDRLWVRETFRIFGRYRNDQWEGGLEYRAGMTQRAPQTQLEFDRMWAIYHATAARRWMPSIHMPRWVSRIALEITDVRVQRLQEISAKDIIAEGAVERAHQDKHLGKCPVSAFDGCCYVDLASLWAAGWDSINGKKHPWQSNPWVWAISFKKV